MELKSPSSLRIGVVGRHHGIRGGLLVHLDNPGSEVLASVTRLQVRPRGAVETGEPRWIGIEQARRKRQGTWIVVFEGIGSKDEANRLSGSELFVDRSAVELGEGEFLVQDIVGAVLVEAGVEVGKVASIYWNGVHDVIVVETVRGMVDFPLVDDRVSGPDESGKFEVEGFEDFAVLAYGGPGLKDR